MLVVVSPAKRLDWTCATRADATEPEFQRDANRLVKVARDLAPEDLMQLMGISESLAELNVQRFRDYRMRGQPETAKPAAFAFAGDTYLGLEAATLNEDALLWAQDHLRILSGLYGVLRPFDRIQPYRLEMGSRLATDRGATLYDFWGDRIAKSLRKTAKHLGTDTLINCASNEYFGAVDLKALKLRVITPSFLEERNGDAKMVSFFAKRARGSMARFMAERRITDLEGLKEFDLGGYRFDPARSSSEAWTFVRDYPQVDTKLAS